MRVEWSMSFRPCSMAMCSAAVRAALTCATIVAESYSCSWQHLTVRAVTHQLLRRRMRTLKVVDRQVRMTSGMMGRRRTTNSEEAISMDVSGAAMRRVRAEQLSALGGVLWKSPEPEAMPAKRTWKETLGWDDGF